MQTSRGTERHILFSAIAAVLTFAATLTTDAQEPAPVRRFLVMADPQFSLVDPADATQGCKWPTDVWQHIPELMRKVEATHFFVCGDIFEYGKDEPLENVERLWDEWGTYCSQFEDTGRIEWVVGGHEFWGDTATEARQLFLKRYPDRLRYTAQSQSDFFVLFDDTHAPGSLLPGALEWLSKTLESTPKDATIWFFGHVPPRNTADWWPQPDSGKGDIFRSRMAGLLTTHGVSAAFFGHEHREGYLGDRGGYPMFETAQRYPLLVEARGTDVRYLWVMNAGAEKPLETAVPALQDDFAVDWQVALLPADAELAKPALDGALTTAAGRALEFTRLVAEDGTIDLGTLRGVVAGSKVVATTSYPLDMGWGSRYARVRSTMPYSIWVNGTFFEDSPPTGGRWHAYNGSRRRDGGLNRTVLLLTLTDGANTFSFVPHTFPPQLASQP